MTDISVSQALIFDRVVDIWRKVAVYVPGVGGGARPVETAKDKQDQEPRRRALEAYLRFGEFSAPDVSQAPSRIDKMGSLYVMDRVFFVPYYIKQIINLVLYPVSNQNAPIINNASSSNQSAQQRFCNEMPPHWKP